MNKSAEEKRLEQITENFIKDFFSQKYAKENEAITNAGASLLGALKEMNIPEKGQEPEKIVSFMQEQVYAFGYDSGHPRFLGFIPSTASKLSWLGDIMTAAYNRHAGSYANFPTGYILEDQVLRWLCSKAGFSKNAGGLFVSGGSMANLTALTIARDKYLKDDQWHLGTAYLSEQTHSSLAKGLHVIGISEKRIRKIPVDEHFRMDPYLLECAIKEDISQGLIPFVAVASAGTTNTGSIDPLPAISAVCRHYNMWMHVDGAFGASILLCHQRRYLLKGIELADSLSWDAHKWLFQTYGCGMILVNNKADMVRTFHSHPEYLKDLDAEEESLNPWNLGIELTRPARGLKLWFTLQVMGSDAVSDAIHHGFLLAEYAQNILRQYPEVEIISPAHMAVINFRFNSHSLTEAQKDHLNARISREILSSGYAGVFTTELKGKKVLRFCTIHPETTEEDILYTIRFMRDCYRKFLAQERRALFF